MKKLAIAVAVVLVAAASPFCLLRVAEITQSAVAAFAALVLLTIIVVGCTVYAVLHRKRNIIPVVGFSVLLLTGFYAYLFYAPTTAGADYVAPTDKSWHLRTGSRIAYTEYRDSVTKPYPVIFLHGGAGAPVNGKEPLAQCLKDAGYDVYQFDQFGCGNSNRSKNVGHYSCRRYVEDLELIRLRIGAEKIILVSHSWGGTLAASYMAAHPTRVANSIFISPGSIWYGADVPHFTPDGAADQNAALAKCPRFAIAHLLAGLGHMQGLYYLFPERNLDNLYMEFHDILNMKLGSGGYYNSKGAGYGFWSNLVAGKTAMKMRCPYKALGRTNARNLVIKGQYDYISMESTMLFCEKIPGTSIEFVKGMGHSVEPEFHETVAQKIITFLLDNKK